MQRQAAQLLQWGQARQEDQLPQGAHQGQQGQVLQSDHLCQQDQHLQLSRPLPPGHFHQPGQLVQQDPADLQGPLHLEVRFLQLGQQHLVLRLLQQHLQDLLDQQGSSSGSRASISCNVAARTKRCEFAERT